MDVIEISTRLNAYLEKRAQSQDITYTKTPDAFTASLQSGNLRFDGVLLSANGALLADEQAPTFFAQVQADPADQHLLLPPAGLKVLPAANRLNDLGFTDAQIKQA